jgi:hypothetical protein
MKIMTKVMHSLNLHKNYPYARIKVKQFYPFDIFKLSFAPSVFSNV